MTLATASWTSDCPKKNLLANFAPSSTRAAAAGSGRSMNGVYRLAVTSTSAQQPKQLAHRRPRPQAGASHGVDLVPHAAPPGSPHGERAAVDRLARAVGRHDRHP